MNTRLFCTTQRIADPRQSYDAALAQTPLNHAPEGAGRRVKRGVAVHSRLWRNGRRLWVAFEGEVPCAVQHSIIEVARQWMSVANITFKLTPERAKAHIRIRLLPSGSDINRSYIGTDALLATDPTMTLSEWPGDEQFVRNVLHEFGHALGMEHEHQHPQADIPWDTEKLFQAAAAGGLTEADVHRDFLDRIERQGALLAPYDRDSIMHYPIPEGATLGDWSVGINSSLSEGDKAFARRAYPMCGARSS